MKPLTIAYAIEHNFTAIDFVKYFKPNWSHDECHYYLWDFTCYPMDLERTIQQLNEQLIEPEQHTAVGC